MKKRILLLVSMFLVLGLTFGMTYRQKAAATVPGVNYLVSADSSGNEGNAASGSGGAYTLHQASSDGRYVAFTSSASNLVSSDTNGQEDVFVKDTQTGAISAVSVSTSGVPSNGSSEAAAISYNGRYVAFYSTGSNLVASTSGGHIYRRDLSTGTTTIVDTSSTGVVGDNGQSTSPDINADGRFVTFATGSSSLLGGFYNSQVVVKDMKTGTLRVLSENSSGTLANQSAVHPSISCDGSTVVFISDASNLVTTYSGNQDAYAAKITWSGFELNDVTPSVNQSVATAQVSCNGNAVVYDTNATNVVSPSTPSEYNVYEYSLPNGSNTLVSQNSGGTVGGASSRGSSLSDDGRYVVFTSGATNLDTSYPNPYSKVGGVFLRDLKTSTTELVNITALGNDPDGAVGYPSISADGSYVVYGYWTPDVSHPEEALITGLTTGTASSYVDTYESKTGF